MKKCQKCFSENDNLMSFCWECGTPLPSSYETTAKTEEFPAQSLPSAPTVYGGKPETETVVNQRVGFTSNFQQPQPPKSKKGIFLLIGGIAAVLFLGLAALAGIVVISLIPTQNNNVTVKTSPTPWTIVKPPTPQLTPTATPQVSFTPPTEPTKKGSFTIYANQGWQLSNIDVVPLEEFRTTVQGKIDISGIRTGVSSSGVSDAKTKVRRIYPEFPTGALLMRTRYADGKYSNIVAVSGSGTNGNWKNYPDERGKIEFCINDNAPENNGGQFTVNVIMTRVPKTKK
ncbi:MAG: hypothetical protein HC846_04820 [Blastocatellia bacterium]|nr:hypothetical protein [Blastocatellia bacterium]